MCSCQLPVGWRPKAPIYHCETAESPQESQARPKIPPSQATTGTHFSVLLSPHQPCSLVLFSEDIHQAPLRLQMICWASLHHVNCCQVFCVSTRSMAAEVRWLKIGEQNIFCFGSVADKTDTISKGIRDRPPRQVHTI